MPEGNLYIEMLEHLCGIKSVHHLPIRTRKEEILNRLGIIIEPNYTFRRSFQDLHQKDNRDTFYDFIYERLEIGHYLSILVHRPQGANAGGFPVLYLHDLSDMANDDCFIAQSGEIINISKENMVTIFSRPRSDEILVTGLKNEYEQSLLRLGGGLRLQLDKIDVSEEGSIKMEMLGEFAFNDYGSRAVARISPTDRSIPRLSHRYKFLLENGIFKVFDFVLPIQESIVTGDIVLITNSIISHLFKRDGGSITRLIRKLMTIRPNFMIHSLEIMYGVVNGQVFIEIIDFDGIDGVPDYPDNGGFQPLAPNETLIRSHLSRSGFLETDVLALKDYIAFSSQIEKAVMAIEDSDLPGFVIQNIREHILSPGNFTTETTSQAKLGGILRASGIRGVPKDDIYEVLYGNDGHVLVMINLCGYDLAYWLDQHGELKIRDRRDIPVLNSIFNLNITSASYGYVYEDD